MARTANEIRKKGPRPHVKLSDIRKRKSLFSPWDRFWKKTKSAVRAAAMVIIDSDDDGQAPGPVTGLSSSPMIAVARPRQLDYEEARTEEVTSKTKSVSPVTVSSTSSLRSLSSSLSRSISCARPRDGSSKETAIEIDDDDDDEEEPAQTLAVGTKRKASPATSQISKRPKLECFEVPRGPKHVEDLTINRCNLASHKRKRQQESTKKESDSILEPAASADIWQFPRDRFFQGKPNEVRCNVQTQRGLPCRYLATTEHGSCHMHASKTQSSSPSSSGSAQSSPEPFSERETAIRRQVKTSRAARPSCYDSDSDLSNPQDDEDDELGRPYRHKEFLEMWSNCEEFCGEMTDEIENTRRVRGANTKISTDDSDGQAKAQYGRLLPRAMKVCNCWRAKFGQSGNCKLIPCDPAFLPTYKTLIHEVLCMKREDVFLDIGHGIGNSCLHAAFTVGCEARGIEVVYDRQAVAEVFRDHLMSQKAENQKNRIVGEVLLRHGRLEDPEHYEFLTKGVNRAYVNNFNGVFAERSMKVNQKWFLDDYVAALFASMAPGAILVTLHPVNLGSTRTEANKNRRNQGLSESDNSSFYELEKVYLGRACDTVKWNQFSGNTKKIYVYKYTKLPQPAGKTVFLCCNPSCDVAKRAVPIDATTTNEEGRCVMNHCACKISAKNLRRQPRKSYSDY